jgi:hypothetical protein
MEPDERFRELADELSRIADAIRSEAPVVFASIAAAVDRARAAWDEICAAAEAHGLAPQSRDELDPAGLRRALQELEERRRAAAARRISWLLDAVHQTDAVFEPLIALQNRVREAAAAVGGGADLAPYLQQFAAIETLIEQWETLHDQAADDLYNQVAEDFGPKLALAAVRGRLTFKSPRPELGADAPPPPAEAAEPVPPPAETAETPLAEPEPVAEPPEAEPAPVGEPPDAEPEPVPETVAEAPYEPVADAAPEPVAEPAAEPEPAVVEPQPSAEPAAIPVRAYAIDAATWRAIELGRAGLAYHRALAADPPDDGVGAGFAALLALAPRVDGSGRLDGLVRDRCHGLWAEARRMAFDDPVRVVAFLAALKVGLLAPGSDAGDLLLAARDGFDGCPALGRIAAAAAELALSGQPVSPFLLSGETDTGKWERRVAAASAAARQWLERQLATAWRRGRADGIWRIWTDPGRQVGRMMRIVADDLRRDSAAAREACDALSFDFAQQLAAFDRELYGELPPLGADAERLIRARVEQGAGIVRIWLGLLDSAPGSDLPAREPLARLRRRLLDDAADAAAELRRLTADNETARRVALAQFGGLAELVTTGLADRRPGRLDALPADAMLNLDLLLLPELVLPADLGLPPGMVPDPAQLAAAIEQGDWSKAAASRIEHRDFPGAALCLEILEAAGTEDAAESREHWREALARARREVDDRQTYLLHQLAAQSHFDQSLRPEQLRIEALIRRAAPPELEDFRTADRLLNEAGDRLDQLVFQTRENAERRLDAEFAESPPPAVQRIRQIIKGGQIGIANDYLERLRQGVDLPKQDDAGPAWGSAFPAFYGSFIDQAIALYRGRGSLAAIREAVSTAPRFLEPLEALGANEPLRLGAMEILDAWELGKRRADEEGPKGVQRLFAALQFRAPKVFKYIVPPKNAADATVHLQCALINDRDTVVLPTFGSEALGHYRVVLLWEQISMQHMLRRITSSLSAEGGPIIVLCFRAVDRPERLALARLLATTNRDSPPILLLDEILLLFLAQYNGGGGRLKAFFDCTLPFTSVDPYVTEGPIAGEMFFDRTRQRAELLAPDAKSFHFLYGGRQTGKTALLKRIESDAVADLKDQLTRIARCIDIRNLGRGPMSPPSGIARLLGEQLKAAGVPVLPTDSWALLTTKLCEWLDDPAGAERRRILLMLDDADAFLRKDAEDDYRELRQMKALVDATAGRLRFIIAGTKAVHRMVRNPRSPVADTGQATLVGTMFGADEAREAERLVRQTFETLGFRFPNRDAISFVLAHCQYQPNVIQLFCKRLLGEIRQKCQDENEQTLLYPIGYTDVDRICADAELRAEINGKVELTLKLDRRYEYLTLLIARLSAGDEQIGLVDGIRLDALRDLALPDWPNGFERPGVPEFRALIDEMVDFGLLRRIDDDTCALLNVAILRALGDPATVERRYLEATGGATVPAEAGEQRMLQEA